MTDIKFQISVKDKSLQGLFERIKAAATKKARNNFSDLRPLVEKSINVAINDNKEYFIPKEDEIGPLGIGKGGSPDSKAERAWIGLKPSSNNGVTTFSVRKKGAEKNSTIGQITIMINEELFYTLSDSIIDISRDSRMESEELSEIPWMRWLIDGKTITGTEFTTDDPSRVSRTGKGIMISGSLWSFEGRGDEIYSEILNKARIIISRKLKEAEGVSILRKLR